MKIDVCFFATPINENASNFKGHIDLSSHDLNIYYEIGYANALKKRVIQIQNKHLDSPSFDLGHAAILYDTTTDEGINQFKKDILKAVKSPTTDNTPLSFYAENDVDISGRIDDQGIVEP